MRQRQDERKANANAAKVGFAQGKAGSADRAAGPPGENPPHLVEPSANNLAQTMIGQSMAGQVFAGEEAANALSNSAGLAEYAAQPEYTSGVS